MRLRRSLTSRRTLAPITATAALALSACGSTHHHNTATLTPAQKASSSFTSAYLRYLDGQGNPDTLPDSTDAARGQAAAGGQIPPKDRRGSLHVVSVRPAKGVPHAQIYAAANQAGTIYLQETLSHTRQGYEVTALLTPDFDQSFTKQTSATIPQPSGSAAADAAAHTFLNGYLPYYYGHGQASAIDDATSALKAKLAANPPEIPPTMTKLYGKVGAIGMQRAGAGWLALAEVTDGQETYQVNLTLEKVHDQWLVTAVTSS